LRHCKLANERQTGSSQSFPSSTSDISSTLLAATAGSTTPTAATTIPANPPSSSSSALPNQIDRASSSQTSRRKRLRTDPEASGDEEASTASVAATGGNKEELQKLQSALPKPNRRRPNSITEDNDSMRGDGRPAPKGSQPQSPSSPQHSLSNGSSNGKSSPTMAKFTNGHGLKLDSNGTGHKHSNGVSGPKDLPAVWEGHSRAEVTRILVQSLNEMGYHNAARALSLESGFQVEGSLVSSFRNAVLGGDWLQTETILFGDRSKNGFVKWNSGSQGLPLVESADRNDMLFSIRQQKYLELLERRDLSSALVVLRQELTPLHQDSDRLHALGALLMCPSAEDLRIQAGWDGTNGESRRILLQKLSKSISPTIMIPEHRLANLFDQVKQTWVDDCLYHNTNNDPSLYVEHSCDRGDFPCYPDITLNDHNNGEAWYVKFSNRGKFLATAGKDKYVHIYEIQETGFKHFRKFKLHDAGVCFLAWSPDDTKIISCTREPDNRLKVFDIENVRPPQELLLIMI
jgi:WD40 repeat protein